MADETEPKYSARVLEKIETAPGFWRSLRVGVFDGETQIGEYARNYPSLFDTFCPFERDGKWYALYSRHYTATRVMSLPDCKDLGGEEPKASGFCPTSFLVPELCGEVNDPADPKPSYYPNHDSAGWAHTVDLLGGGKQHFWPDDPGHPAPDPEKTARYKAACAESKALYDAWRERNPIVSRYATWGLVSGCQWGDDGSDKIEYLDLADVANGVIRRDARFGYVELPRNCKLKDAVDTEGIYTLNDPPEETFIYVAVPVRFDLTGRRHEDD